MQQIDDKISDDNEQTILRYTNMVYRLAFARCGCAFDADEVFQEVFFRYLKKKPMVISEEHRKAWLIRVTINCCKNVQRFKLLQKVQPEEQVVFLEEDDGVLYTELQKLSPKYREVIHLFYYEDLSIEQIGKLLQRKPSTVRTQLTRARGKLKIFLEEDDNV